MPVLPNTSQLCGVSFHMYLIFPLQISCFHFIKALHGCNSLSCSLSASFLSPAYPPISPVSMAEEGVVIKTLVAPDSYTVREHTSDPLKVSQEL